MQAKERSERPRRLKWFVLPNESHKWDFVFENYVGDYQQDAASETDGITEPIDESFDKDYIVAYKRRKQRDRYYY
jgi:hypothetical protein